MKTIALILIDTRRGRLGHAASLSDTLAGESVLQHTVNRAAAIQGIDAVVLATHAQHSESTSDPTGLPCSPPQGIDCRRSLWSLTDSENAQHEAIAAARKWSLTAWRGGIAGMTAYDELLPAGPIARLLAEHQADAAVVVRGDWCCFDPAVADEQLAVYRSAPESYRLVFTQAPPGLSALVLDRSVAEDLATHRTTVARLLCYNPDKPALDPISRDVCVAVPASVRDRHRRFIHDTPRAAQHLREIADRLGSPFALADAAAITEASRTLDTEHPERQLDRLPQQWTLELTPQRQAVGPIVPQHHIDLPRSAMDLALARDLMQQLGTLGDASVLLGGLGDALLHDRWLGVAHEARQSGVMGIGIETDLLCDDGAIEALRSAPLDVLSVRINADTAAVYEQLMGLDGYKTVLDNLQSLYTGGGRFDRTRKPGATDTGTGGLGWIVPRLVKVADNLKDMETFFERWTRIMGWAVIDRFETGEGLIPDQSPVPMRVPRPPAYAPPRHRHKRRLTVLADGTVTLCGQDWLGRAPLGNANEDSLEAIWRRSVERASHLLDTPEAERPVCPDCLDWLAVQHECLHVASA